MNKERLLILCQAIINNSSLAEFTTKELDDYYVGAEKVVYKALSKPMYQPKGEELVKEIRSWIDFFEWDFD